MDSSLLNHTVVFEREVRGRVHRFTYSMPCRMHHEIYETIVERAGRRNVILDIESLIDSAKRQKTAAIDRVFQGRFFPRNRI